MDDEIRLLIVEDDDSHAELLKRGLESQQNYRVEFSNTLTDAREKFLKFNPSIILTDWRLPDGEGIELISKNSNGDIELPLVLMTSFGNENLAVEAIKNGALDYIVKSPETLTNIGRILQRALREWKLIEDKRQISKALAESEFRYRVISEMMTDYIFSAEVLPDNSFRVDWRYGKLHHLYGYSPEEIEERNEGFFFTIHPDDYERVMLKYQNLLGNREVNIEYRIITKNGDVNWIHNYMKPIWDLAQNRVVRFIAAVQDITAQKKAEADKVRLHNLESIGILAGGIAHDFNNILGSILGRVGLALMGLPEGALKNHLQSVEKAVNRAVSLTKQLLAFSKGGKPEKCIISVKRIIQETAKFSLSGSSVDVQFDFKDTHNVEADSGQISQVIQNLVINAKQAMPMGGIIKISTSDEVVDSKPYIKIVVKDSGIGIPKEYLNKIFDPYFSTKETGSGLGLSVCYSIIDKHDGQINVNSEPGKGTSFEILLPASEKPEESSAVEFVAPKKTSYKILIMDDDIEIRELLKDMLEAMNHEVVVTKEGEECINVFSENFKSGKKFDLLLMDLTIKGGMGGLEATEKIKMIDPAAKVVISSGYSDKNVVDFVGAGFAAKLNKPFSVTDLSKIISVVMD